MFSIDLYRCASEVVVPTTFALRAGETHFVSACGKALVPVSGSSVFFGPKSRPGSRFNAGFSKVAGLIESASFGKSCSVAEASRHVDAGTV